MNRGQLKAKDRLEVLEKIAQLEREGRFDEDVEEDPPTKELMPDDIDYLRRKISSKIKTKLTYKVGERLDTTGMKLTVRTNSETKDITTGFTCTPTSFTKAGEYEIKVIYGGKETTFKVTVTEDTAASPEVSATPTVSPTPSTEPQPVAKKSNALLIVGIIAAILALAALGAYVYVMNRGKGGRRRR